MASGASHSDQTKIEWKTVRNFAVNCWVGMGGPRERVKDSIQG
ncbi:uncharacterized protein G2W53_001260 [Senna tora]|uniref:Uncharacterized protein n=1 Tax=Senna tora TaxID=362788 RepID=A0A834XH63_9FABA|nr:uncharacterized protein G2W53_001260 [Senna tora]